MYNNEMCSCSVISSHDGMLVVLPDLPRNDFRRSLLQLRTALLTLILESSS